MLPTNKFNFIIAVLVSSLWLYGCGASTYPVPAPAVSQEPAPEVQTADEKEEQGPAITEPDDRIAEPVQEISDSYQEPLESYLDEPRVSPLPEAILVSYSDIEFIQHRLIVYENKLEHWQEISEIQLQVAPSEEISSRKAECLQKLNTILSGYRQLMEKMQQEKGFYSDTAKPIDFKKMQQIDIAFLESRCNELLETVSPDQFELMPETEPDLSFGALEEIIANHLEQGNYQDVLFTYDRLIRNFPDRQPSLATRLNYGRALQYTGQVEAAARHFKNMLASGEPAIDPLSIQREIADLLLASSNPAAAELYYDRMLLDYQSISAEKNWAQEQLAFLLSVDPGSQEMIAYMKLLREFQSYDYKMHAPRLNQLINGFAQEHAGSPAAVSALRLKNFAVNQLKSWFGRQLVEIDALVAEKKFTEASDLLKEISRYHLPAELQAVLQKTYYDIAQAEIQEQELQRRIKELELTEQWNSAVNLLDSQQYDAAIAAFEAMIGTGYEEKAKSKITEAANQAAGEMRKEAASLFIRAGKAPSLEQKKNLLVQSYKLLAEILAKYPQTELLDKVQQNISILEEQIERIDPSLLEELRQEKPAQVTADPSGPGANQFQ